MVVYVCYHHCMLYVLIICIHYGNLTWQWKIHHLKMYFLFKMGIFHCYVCLPEGIYIYTYRSCPFQSCFDHPFLRPKKRPRWKTKIKIIDFDTIQPLSKAGHIVNLGFFCWGQIRPGDLAFGTNKNGGSEFRSDDVPSFSWVIFRCSSR